MNRRRRPVVINLIKTQLGYIPEGVKKQKTQNVQFDVQSHLSQSSSVQDPFHMNFNTAPKLAPSSIHTTIPVTSQWFCLDKVNLIQKQALPQFFGEQETDQSDKNQNDYIYYRNGIVTLWRQNNKKYLTTAYCRKNLAGDSCSIMRVHGLLQDWGIINFPSKQFKGYLKKFDQRIECMVCSNKTLKLYITQEVGQPFQICQSCFNEKIFPQQLDSSKFRLLDLTQQHFNAQQNPWTQQETYKLLEMIEKYRHNWQTISAQFPTRSMQSLVLRYLKLPYLNISNFSIFEQGQDTKRPIDHFQPPTIFEDYNNSIQSASAFLYYNHIKDPQNSRYLQILQAAERHSQFLASKKQTKIRNILRFIIDFQMNKLQGKLVCLHQYKTYIEAEKSNNENVRKNTLATILHGLGLGQQQ